VEVIVAVIGTTLLSTASVVRKVAVAVALSLGTLVAVFTATIGVLVGLDSIWITDKVGDLSDVGLWIVLVTAIFSDIFATLSFLVGCSVSFIGKLSTSTLVHP
jgi:hypothetical protein